MDFHESMGCTPLIPALESKECIDGALSMFYLEEAAVLKKGHGGEQ
jgi:hypothetical protein